MLHAHNLYCNLWMAHPILMCMEMDWKRRTSFKLSFSTIKSEDGSYRVCVIVSAIMRNKMELDHTTNALLYRTRVSFISIQFIIHYYWWRKLVNNNKGRWRTSSETPVFRKHGAKLKRFSARRHTLMFQCNVQKGSILEQQYVESKLWSSGMCAPRTFYQTLKILKGSGREKF